MSKWFLLSFFLSLFLTACDMWRGNSNSGAAGTGGESTSSSMNTTGGDDEKHRLDAKRGAHVLKFSKVGESLSEATLQTLATKHGLQTWEAFDPYYEKEKRWKTIPLLPILQDTFSLDAEALRAKSFVMRASDGYSVPIAGEQLLTDDAYLAVEDLDFPEWELAGKQQANPGPVYLVWRSPEHHDLHAWPRPWQLAEIDLASFEQTFSRTIPDGVEEGGAVAKGFEVFKTHCVRCHSVNQHGGKLGPELNVPQNITEYRPEEQIRAYIANPMTFRYGSMPPFENVLSAAQIDQVIAYLEHMKNEKEDPKANAESTPSGG